MGDGGSRWWWRTGLTALGAAITLLGLYWVARNRGLVGHPDFMATEQQWLYRGMVLVVFGAGLGVLSRRL